MTSTLKAAALAAGALVLLFAPAGASYSHRDAPARNLDLTSSAHPSEARPNHSDQATDISSTWARTVRADTTALASTNCDGCNGDATTLQVLYVNHGRDVSVDNAAVAWSQCADCGGTALSVQVVVLAGGHQVRADNRAFAVNAACAGCNTAAIAYQLVVVTPRHSHLSKEAAQELRDWVAAQAAALRHDPAALSRRPAAAARAEQHAADGLEGLVNGDLGSRTRELDVSDAPGR
ncbi:hypothetical protein [Nocardioides sp. CER19]|uniref:hypothetical protein n=1 Tax=Nocardioides sp. CER19 TaxID=3038538 RepID=UPI00244B18F9|nr:hypothetical protein [Nocardioides sp. CER19]MDH2413914.1 hypothetical protein [Nocardioides sp. CER19]